MNYLYKNLLSASEKLNTVYKTDYNPTFDHLDYHPHFELYFCPKRINQRAKIFGTDYKINDPCIILSMPYTVHFMMPENNVPEFERYVVYFSKELIDSFSNWIIDKNLFTKTSIFLIKDNKSLVEALNPVFDLKLSQRRRALAFINFLCASGIENITPYKVINSENTVVNILEYLNNNIDNDLNGDTVARSFHISRATLDRIFKKYVGQSLHKTVIELRLNTALSLLKTTDLSIKEIALKCGFISEEYFYSFFKKHLGITPLSYKRH